jgi:hypothetical protein
MGGSVGDEATEQIILGLGQEVFTAIRHKDVSSLRGILAEDFVHRSADGSESGRDKFLEGIGGMPLEVTSVRGEHLRVNVYGQMAVMTGVQHAEWRQGDVAEGVSSVAFVDVFALREGGWLMVLAYGVELQS